MISLLQQLFAIEADFVGDSAKQRRGLELLLAASSAMVMVAEDDRGTVIGMATAQLLISTAEGGPAISVEDVVVLPDRRRGGVGTALLGALARWGADRGALRLQLLADRTNGPALQFYRRTGWRPTQLICLRHFAVEILDKESRYPAFL